MKLRIEEWRVFQSIITFYDIELSYVSKIFARNSTKLVIS